MNFSKLSFLFILLVSTSSCTKNKNLPSQDRVNEAGLSEVISIKRKGSISDLTYLFEIDLRTANKSSSYGGTSSIIFNFKKSKFKNSNLTIDFEGGTVSEVYANGKRLTDFVYNNHFISIPKNHLKEKKNILKVKYSQNFSKTGSGLYKFKDKTDGKTYVYTDFEPYDANIFAPIFDQPNLKATYSLNVKSPSSWVVVSSVMEQSSKVDNLYKFWSFPKSQKFSTYIFSLHAGPYKIWTDKVKLKTKEIPLRLMARQSISKYVKPEFWFKSTKQGFNFFEQYFQTDYPYTKYDQLIVPDFNSGAMENVAAVTFNEVLVSREKTPLRAQRRGLSNVIFHEMAHMWFGNLVTMDWWNDLWLNESFATYMAYSGLFYNTKYTESWLNFFNRTKQWAYSEDTWRTTHNIEGDIPSTTVATANFDGITYGKGASSLKQLVYLIGEENFKAGLADYFKTYAEQNTIRKNFIDSLQNHTNEDLNAWTKEWLQSKGLNTLKSSFTCFKSTLKEITFTQGVASGDEVFRTHKLTVALWGSKITPEPTKTFPVRISGKQTVWTPSVETACPSAVFPNWHDHGYVQVLLDDKSFSYISSNISRFKSQLFRSQFWSIIGNMLSFGNLRPEKIISLIKTQLPKEQDFDTAGAILSLLYPQKPVFYFYSNQSKAISDRRELSSLLKNLILKVEKIDLKKTFFEHWVYSSYQDQPEEVYKCLKKCSFPLGFELDIDKKWLIAKTLAAVNYKNGSYISVLFKEDSSRRGALNKLAAEVRLAKNKALWLSKALDPNLDLSLKERNQILFNLVPYAQRDQHFEFVQTTFFEKVDHLSELPERVQRAFARNFSPLFCGDYKKNIPITEEQIKGSDWIFSVKKSLLKKLDVEERCLKIKKASKNG